MMGLLISSKKLFCKEIKDKVKILVAVMALELAKV